MDFSASKCKGIGLHKFATLKDNGDAVLERCVKCGEKNVVKVVKGQVDVVRYSQRHMREFLLPQHRLFAREFPASPMNRAQRRSESMARIK